MESMHSENNNTDNLEIEIEKKKAEFLGIEYDTEAENSEEEQESMEQPFNVDKIRVDQQMLSVKYMLELMEQDLLELNPGYQRRRVWTDNKRKSLLIESLILRIPIPAFYFYENKDGKFQVIDGQQRLATIKEFVNGDFKLTGLEYLGADCNKKRFSDLEQKYIQRIYRTQIAVNILDARSPKKVIYEIFRRVNTGGMNLNPQEMRNAICRQEVRDFLVRSTWNQNYLIATRRRVKDDRMDAQELVLRFYAFYMAYDFEREELQYNSPNIAEMLDAAIEKLNDMPPEEREKLYKIFDTAMERAYEAFGKYAFSKIYRSGGEIMRNMDYINKSLFSSFSVLLAHSKYDGVKIEECRDQLLYTLADALQNYYYTNSITIGTGDRRNVYANFGYSREVLEKCLVQ